ncbi:hypothetical protein MGH68_16665 [Erysipelothrix sp. D19-032]
MPHDVSGLKTYSDEVELEKDLAVLSQGRGADAVFLCAGSGASYLTDKSLDWLKDRGKSVIVGDIQPHYSREKMFVKEIEIRISRAVVQDVITHPMNVMLSTIRTAMFVGLKVAMLGSLSDSRRQSEFMSTTISTHQVSLKPIKMFIRPFRKKVPRTLRIALLTKILMDKEGDCMNLLDKIETEMNTASDALVNDMKSLDGDIIILGVSGKIGYNLSALLMDALKKAGIEKNVYGVARFSMVIIRVMPLRQLGYKRWLPIL